LEKPSDADWKNTRQATAPHAKKGGNEEITIAPREVIYQLKKTGRMSND